MRTFIVRARPDQTGQVRGIVKRGGAGETVARHRMAEVSEVLGRMVERSETGRPSMRQSVTRSDFVVVASASSRRSDWSRPNGRPHGLSGVTGRLRLPPGES